MAIQLFVTFLQMLPFCIVVLTLTSALPITSKPIEDRLENIEWSGWIMMAQNQPSQEKARKVTPKSIFVLPDRKKTLKCPPGEHPSDSKCVPVITVDREKLLIAELTYMFSKGPVVFETEWTNSNNHYEDTQGEEDSPVLVIDEEPFVIDGNKNDNFPDAPLKFNIFTDSFPNDDMKSAKNLTKQSDEKIFSVDENKNSSYVESFENTTIAVIEFPESITIKSTSTIDFDDVTEINTVTENNLENKNHSMPIISDATDLPFDFEHFSTTEDVTTTTVTEEEEEELNYSTTIQMDNEYFDAETTTITSASTNLLVSDIEEMSTTTTTTPVLTFTNLEMELTTYSSHQQGNHLISGELQNVPPTESKNKIENFTISTRNDTQSMSFVSNLNYEQSNITRIEDLFDSPTETVQNNEVEPLPTDEVFNNRSQLHIQKYPEEDSSVERYSTQNSTATMNIFLGVMPTPHTMLASAQSENSKTKSIYDIQETTATAWSESINSTTKKQITNNENITNSEPSTETIKTPKTTPTTPTTTSTTPTQSIIISSTTSTTKTSNLFWWLPSDWQTNASGEQSLLLRFWSALQDYRSRTK